MTTSVHIQRLPQTTGCFDADRAVEFPLEQFSQKIPPNTTSRDIGGLKRVTLATCWKRIRLVLLYWELLQIQSAGINSRYIAHTCFRHVFPYFHVNLNVISHLYTHTHTHTLHGFSKILGNERIRRLLQIGIGKSEFLFFKFLRSL